MIFDTRVNEVLAIKGSRDVSTLPSDATLAEAVQVMRKNSIGSVVVVEEGRVVGIISERDCLLHICEEKRFSTRTRLSQVMKRDILVVGLESTARECFAMMTAFRARHLPVVEDDELLGLVSIGDIVRALVDDQQYAIEQLISYVTGSYGYLGDKTWLSWIPEEVRMNRRAANDG